MQVWEGSALPAANRDTITASISAIDSRVDDLEELVGSDESTNASIGFRFASSVTGTYDLGALSGALSALTTGTHNIAIGRNAGSTITTGSQNIYLGGLSTASGATVSNEIVIGYNRTGNGSNTTTIGNSSCTAVHLTGKLVPTLPVILPTYTVVGVPSAATYARGLIYVSDGTSNKRLAISDGSNWRFPDGNVVS
jgi:hypothetical protein